MLACSDTPDCASDSTRRRRSFKTRLLRDIQNQLNVADDTLVYGKDQDEHDRALDRVLQRLDESGASLNKRKVSLANPS